MIWALVFVLTFATDWLWAFCVQATARHHAWRASFGTVGLVLCSSLATIAFVDDHMLVIPACLGAFAGTYLAVRRSLN